MRRGSSGSPVSFFAFQDIITAVSGILIVVVLLLSLELVERPQAEAAPPVGAADLEAAVAEAEAERDRLRAELADAAAVVRAAAGTSLGELRREESDLRAEAARLERRIDETAAAAEALAAAEAALEVRRFDAAETAARLERANGRIEEAERRIEDAERDDRVVFTLPRGHDRPGWLVVIGGDEVAAAPLGRAERPVVFRGDAGPGPSSADRFLDWWRGRPDDYFLLLTRPDGIDAFRTIDAAFAAAGTSYGFDVVGRDRRVLHPERGAAP